MIPVVSAAIRTEHSVKGISTFMRLSYLLTEEPQPGRWDGDGPFGHQITSPDDQQQEQSSEDFGSSDVDFGFTSAGH